jgi:predicted O-methyltransferase YrrM
LDLRPDRVRAAMASLEKRDAEDRSDGTPQAQRLRAISPEVGQLLLTLVVGAGAQTIVEIGTSGGYSTLWLASGARWTGGRVTTFEIDPAKIERARGSFDAAGVTDIVDQRAMDGGAGLAAFEGTADVVFIDCEKDDYLRMLAPAIAALRPAGLLIADNLISHEADLAGFRDTALADPRLTGLVVPIGRGELVAVRL